MYLEFGMVKRTDEIANEHLKAINQSRDFAKDPGHTIRDISLAKVKENWLKTEPSFF